MNKYANRLLLKLDQYVHSDPAALDNLYMLQGLAGLPDMDVGLEAANALEAHRYAILKRSPNPDEVQIQITPEGVVEAYRLRLPLWRRWLDDKTWIRQLAGGMIYAIIGAAATSILRLLC